MSYCLFTHVEHRRKCLSSHVRTSVVAERCQDFSHGRVVITYTDASTISLKDKVIIRHYYVPGYTS